jgi:hypothetical protein
LFLIALILLISKLFIVLANKSGPPFSLDDYFFSLLLVLRVAALELEFYLYAFGLNFILRRK